MTEKINPQLTFEIKNSEEFLNKLLEEYNDFDKQYLNPRFAMNCAITSWHMTDWTYHEFFKKDSKFQDSHIKEKNGCVRLISGLLKYQQFTIKNCPDLELMRLITNGTKHCILNDKSRLEVTKIHSGDYSTDYSRHDYDVTRFVVKIDENKEIDFEKALLKTIDFWKKLVKNGKII